MMEFTHYGEERDLICTEQEREIFEIIKDMFRGLGFDDSLLRLVRVSDGYVTAKIEPWDVARIKYTPRAKWVLFPTAERADQKNRILSPEDVRSFPEQIQKTIDIINKYHDSPIPRL